MMRPVVLLTALLWSVTAQAPAQTARVSGVIVDSMGRGLDGVEVLVLGSDLRTGSRDGGKFTLAGLPAGRITLQARRIGFKAVEVMADLDPLREATVSIRMMAEGVVLPEIEVKGRTEKPERYAATTKYDDFFRRQRMGFGAFISRDQIEKMNAFHAVDILRAVPGVIVTFREADPISARVRFTRCRGPGANADVYIDGRRVAVRDSVEAASGGLGSRVSAALAGVSAPHIEMIEVFRGPSEIPAEYDAANACAIIAIWTRWNPQ
jgi:hypothetical protein